MHACASQLKEDNRALWVTDLSQHAVCLLTPTATTAASPEVPLRLAIAFGTESVGCTYSGEYVTQFRPQNHVENVLHDFIYTFPGVGTEELLQAADRRVYLPLRGFADSLNLSVSAALVLPVAISMPTSFGICYRKCRDNAESPRKKC